MARQTPDSLFSLFGFLIWGDLGDLTLYRNKRGKIVAFLKTRPTGPPSDAQAAQRDKLTAAAAEWRALSAPQRDQWELATRRASLCMHGYDLFVHWTLMQDDQAIATIERQTETTLLPP